MFNPLAPIVHWISLKKEIPPVHFSYIEPMAHYLPEEISVENFDSGDHQLIASYVGIENFSNVVLKDVRIKLKSPLEYAPRVRTNDARGHIQYQYSENDHEITISKIDPEEAVYIDLFPDVDQLVPNFEPKVIIDGKSLTRGMIRYGNAIKYPSLMWSQLLLVFVVIFAMGSVFFAWNSGNLSGAINGDWELLENAQKTLEGGCYLKVVEVNEETEKDLLWSSLSSNAILEINQSNSLEELLSRDKIVLCIDADDKLTSVSK